MSAGRIQSCRKQHQQVEHPCAAIPEASWGKRAVGGKLQFSERQLQISNTGDRINGVQNFNFTLVFFKMRQSLAPNFIFLE